MGLRERLARFRQFFEAVTAVATCRDSLFFADLCWSPFDSESELLRYHEGRDFGVIFETASRVVAIEEHSGELRFYSGGWRTHVYDQPNELGVFRSEENAIRYAEAFLVQGLHPEMIVIPRGVLSATYDWGREESARTVKHRCD